MKAKRIAIYALRDANGVRYVGQTGDLKKRLLAHRCGPYKNILRNCEARVLRYTTKRNALRIESQVILAYFKRGQCELNIRHAESLICIETNRFFPTIIAAAKFFGCTTTTMRKHIGKIRKFSPEWERLIGNDNRITLIRFFRDYVWTHYEI